MSTRATLSDEDDKIDECREEDERHGPRSVQIADETTESDELSFLRVENALLRKKIAALEKTSRGDRHSSMRPVVDEAEVQRIDELLKKAEDAKLEAMNYVTSTSRDKLGHDVKVLQAILKKAKAERQAFKKKIKSTEEKLVQERKKIEQEEVRFQVDREIFAKILKDDRASYKSDVELLVAKMTELQREKHELFEWTTTQHAQQLQEIRKLTRALGRVRKAVDDQKTKNVDVLSHVHRVQASVAPSSRYDTVQDTPTTA